MRLLFSTVARLFFVAWVCVLLGCSIAAAAEPAITADFDGDGQHDRATLDYREPSLLRVWLSTTGTTLVIRTATPVLRLVATDLDGDHRAELIGRDSDARLHVWTKKRRGFHAFRPYRQLSASLGRPMHRRWDDGPVSDSSESSLSGASALGLTLSADPRGPTLDTTVRVVSAERPVPSVRPLAPLSPRPPPRSL